MAIDDRDHRPRVGGRRRHGHPRPVWWSSLSTPITFWFAVPAGSQALLALLTAAQRPGERYWASVIHLLSNQRPTIGYDPGENGAASTGS